MPLIPGSVLSSGEVAQPKISILNIHAQIKKVTVFSLNPAAPGESWRWTGTLRTVNPELTENIFWWSLLKHRDWCDTVSSAKRILITL